MSMSSNGWDSLKKGHCPRIWLLQEDSSFLLSWEHIDLITASADFLTLKIDCRVGRVTITAPESIQLLFEELQLERVRLIDGRKLKMEIKFSI